MLWLKIMQMTRKRAQCLQSVARKAHEHLDNSDGAASEPVTTQGK